MYINVHYNWVYIYCLRKSSGIRMSAICCKKGQNAKPECSVKGRVAQFGSLGTRPHGCEGSTVGAGNCSSHAVDPQVTIWVNNVINVDVTMEMILC